MANGEDTRHHPNRKVSKKQEEKLRDMAWLKWQVEGPREGDIDANVEAHYQTLLKNHFEEKGQ
jgi:hypothetical protein